MTTNGSANTITTLEDLQARYGTPMLASLAKEIDHVNAHYGAMIEASPFFAIATCGADGLDCSPRGDAAGFVRIADEKTLLIPDRPGNNRTDTLRNIIGDPRVGLLFLIPGIGETLRVNGRAEISVDPSLLESFAINGKLPRSVIVVHVESVYFQCSKAIVRSQLWNPERHRARDELPSAGKILAGLAPDKIDAADYDRAAPARIQAMLY
jgi:PPOX class probable FMN-dependent enzyme